MSASVGFNTCISNASQYKQVFDEAIKKSVFANSPVTVEIGLKLENSCNKGEFIKKLFDEMDKNNAWGKFAFRLQGTEISSKDVASICQEMEKRKDKPLNIQFDNKINKFSSDDYLNIFAATLGSQTTCFPFMSEQNCPVSEELLDTFKDRTPNIIEGSSGQKNLRIIHQSCGYQDVAQMQKDITQTCQNGMPLKEFVAQKVHKMDEGYLLMLQERQSAIDWVSKSHDTLDKQALMQGQKNSYRAFFELLNDAVTKEIEIRNKENHNVETASREQTEVQNKTTLEEYTETIDKANASTYDEFMIATQTHNHQNMWALAQKLENENEIFDGWQNQIASEIAIENPRFNTNEVFQKITENVQNNFNCFEKNEEGLSEEEKKESRMAQYAQTAEAIGKIADVDESKSMMSLNLLDNLTNKTINLGASTLGLPQYTDERRDHFVTSELMKTYANCDQNATRAMISVDKINALRECSNNANQDFYDNLQKKGSNSYYNSLENIMFNVAQKDINGAKEVAAHILKTMKEPENKEAAEAYLNLLKNAAIQNPDCADIALNKIHKTFSKFSSSENVQKKALSAVNEFSSYSIFRDDAYVLEKMDTLNKKFKDRIDAQSLLRKRGQETDWEDDEFNFNQQMEFSKSKKREIDPKIVEKYKGDYGFEL